MNNIKKITAAEEKGLGFEQLETVCGGEAESAAVKMEQASLFDSALMSLLGMIL